LNCKSPARHELSQALKKNLPWTRVVFVDLNISDMITDAESPALAELLALITEAERTLRIRGAPAPSAYLFLVNQPFHYNLASFEGTPLIGALGFRLDTFQPRLATFREMILGREMHPEMHALIESMKIHGDPPSTFDGQHPEFVFGKHVSRDARWLVGNEYLVPGPNNKEVMAQLQSGTAVPEEKAMYGVFVAGDKNFIVKAPMTDLEIEVYRRIPETFFGVIQYVTRQASDSFQLAEFFYENYKDTPKATLFEWLKEHPAIERLRGFTQKDLAIFVCEQWALGAKISRPT
jgi:hypothetical protein